MALHGTIEVNGEVIGEWVAINRGPVDRAPDHRSWCRYECRVAAERRAWTGRSCSPPSGYDRGLHSPRKPTHVVCRRRESVLAQLASTPISSWNFKRTERPVGG